MSRKITVTLNDAAAAHLTDLLYSLDMPKGAATITDCINHCLIECYMFENICNDQITNYLMDNHPETYKQLIKKLNIQQQ